MKVQFEVDGRVKFIYDDTLAKIAEEVGTLTVKRASHVEPVMTGKGVQWEADMSPVGGPKLGLYSTRELALQAETVWLETNGLPVPA